MLQLWANSTCCVVPSRLEPAGIVYVEAMHAGIPSIGTTQGGSADIIGDAGVTVDPGNVVALRAAMLSFCDPLIAESIGRRAQLRSHKFSWTRVAADLVKALELAAEGCPTAEVRQA
jgi:glycosyltransferase involved in cell wall biosynthesis